MRAHSCCLSAALAGGEVEGERGGGARRPGATHFTTLKQRLRQIYHLFVQAKDLQMSDMVVPIDWEQTSFQSKSNYRTDALVVQAMDMEVSDVEVLIGRDQNITHLQTHPKRVVVHHMRRRWS